ncbi:MAG: MFS transporter [Polyangiaceae bacterium]|nr:MFS transporter [Polyangiaceae bacterium]
MTAARGVATVAAAVGTHGVIGGVYAWSVYEPALRAQHGFSRLSAQAVFGTTIACFALSMLIAGRWQGTFGAGALLRVAAVVYAVGYLLAAGLGASVAATLLGIGVVGGAGIGVAYVSALTAAVTAASGRRGLITGLVTGGFAAGSAVAAPLVASSLESGWSVPAAFAGQGALGFFGLMLASLWVSDRSAKRRPSAPESGPRARWQFLAWSAGGLFGSSLAGLTIIGALASLAAGSDRGPALGAAMVVAFALGNTLGRPAWGALFDRLGSLTAPASLGGLGLAILVLASSPSSPAVMLVGSLVVGFCFAAGFVVYAANTVRRLGPASMARVYPVVFLAYGLAALVGPPIGGALRDASGTPVGALLTAAAVALTTGLALLVTRQAAGEAWPGTAGPRPRGSVREPLQLAHAAAILAPGDDATT